MSKLFFVVHKHDATRLHYDFRLQIGSGMPSWAIPKGPTLDPAMKRLAMPTPVHPLEYRNFEGVLPEGKYGAGPVMIWDEGYYIPERDLGGGKRLLIDDLKEAQSFMSESLNKGEVKFKLYGKKLNGSFALVKTKGFGPKDSWLLIKHNDEYAKKGYDANDYKNSVKSGKTIEEIANSKPTGN